MSFAPLALETYCCDDAWNDDLVVKLEKNGVVSSKLSLK